MSTSRLSDDYQIGEVLGVGTVGTIYRAIDRHTGQPVAIKKLHPTVSADRLIRARFRREMLILGRLYHPNIVRYYGGGEEDGMLYYVMELVDAGTVKSLLETDGPLPWQAVTDVGRQLCSALQFAHNHGVIHRDLKPGNLFLTTEGLVKLGDFGIARDLKHADITSSGMTVGTHAYMAPEQIRGDFEISGKSDLYALGCCLFELLTGRTPFLGENFAQLFEQHLRSIPPRIRQFLPLCPVELDDIINQMLAKNPEDRPFNARQIQGVMLELDTSPSNQNESQTAVNQTAVSLQSDVGSESVAARGREILQRRIWKQTAGISGQNVSWKRLAVVFCLIVAVVITITVLKT